MAGIGLYMNWINVSVTPQGGSAIPMTGVTSIKPSRSSRQEAYYGDAYSFARFIKNVEKKRSISLSAGNVGQLNAIPDNTACTITGTLLDPKNGALAGGGAIAVTLINAVLEKQESDGQNNKYAQGSATFNAAGGTDDSGNEIDPLSWTAL